VSKLEHVRRDTFGQKQRHRPESSSESELDDEESLELGAATTVVGFGADLR